MKEIKVEVPTRATPKEVWNAWRKKHRAEHGNGSFKEGYIGQANFGKKAAFFEMDKVEEGKSFCILWKAFFVKLFFTHSVEQSNKGSMISYTARFKGFFAPIVYWKINKKLRGQMKDSITQFVYALENKIPFR
jgi:hypothetical protein